MTIKSKLTLVNILVIAFSLIIILLTIFKALSERTVISQAKELNVLSIKLSHLIHETQKERGASAGFLGSKGTKFTEILPSQRLLTNEKNAKLTALSIPALSLDFKKLVYASSALTSS